MCGAEEEECLQDPQVKEPKSDVIYEGGCLWEVWVYLRSFILPVLCSSLPFGVVCHLQSAASRVRQAWLLPDQHRVCNLHRLLRQPTSSLLQTACRPLTLVPKHLHRKLMLISAVNPKCLLVLFPLSSLNGLHKCCPWRCGAPQHVPGGCRVPASPSEPGLPPLEQTAASSCHSGGHGAHLPETHHRQYIHL